MNGSGDSPVAENKPDSAVADTKISPLPSQPPTTVNGSIDLPVVENKSDSATAGTKNSLSSSSPPIDAGVVPDPQKQLFDTTKALAEEVKGWTGHIRNIQNLTLLGFAILLAMVVTMLLQSFSQSYASNMVLNDNVVRLRMELENSRR
jgi:hypothetical protein